MRLFLLNVIQKPSEVKMLQSVRDNMKGTLVVVVIVIFIVPMVLSGVGTSFLGSAAGTDAATVNGRSISRAELGRAIYMQKQRILAQPGVDPSAEFLKDENLREPVLQRLIHRAALLSSAQKGGMAVSAKKINALITGQEDFFEDGKFSSQKYRALLGNIGYTPATYKSAVAEDTLLNQHSQGLEASAFVTDAELDALISSIQQKRSFYAVQIPENKESLSFDVSEEEINAHYQDSQAQFLEEEKVSVNYIELSVDTLAEQMEVAEDELKEQYEQERAEFNSAPEYQVAHILLENKTDGSQAANVEKIKAELAAGKKFAELVTQYSDDAGTKEIAGDLGVLTPGAFPKPFEDAVYALSEGEVSAPVETESGIHFIKVLKKDVPEPPSFEERKSEIAKEIKTLRAEDIYISLMEQLSDITFSTDDLSTAAQELKLEIKSTELFGRNFAPGIAGKAAFREQAFSDEVLIDGHNSKVVELEGNKAVVLRKLAHEPEHIKPLEQVSETIKSTLIQKKTDEEYRQKAQALLDQLKQGADPKVIAEANEYQYSVHEKVSRSDISVGSEILTMAFAVTAAETGVVYDVQIKPAGGAIVIALKDVVKGLRSDMPEQQLRGLTNQLKRENVNFAASSYQAMISSAAKVSTN